MLKIIFTSIFLIISFNANANDTILQCKTKAYGIKEVSPSEMVDGYYTITNNGTQIKIGENKWLLPLETLPNEYRWTWPANETAPLIIVESINRITGKYYMQITGPKGTMTAGEGTCQRGELKF